VKTWDLKRTVFSVSDFVGWAEAKQLVLSPSFQRRPVWSKPAKSQFIDTLVRGLPVPIIFLREKTNVRSLKTIREVVDGQQRLRTVLAFVRPSTIENWTESDQFHISKTHHEELAGLSFKDFPSDAKRRILSYQFSVDVLPADTDDADVLKIFSRINATGTKANAQEIRNAEYFGAFKTSVYDSSLEQLDRWREWKIFSENDIARMQEAELTSQLYILMFAGIFGKSKPLINRFYRDNEEDFALRKTVERRFSETMDKIEGVFGDSVLETVFRKKTLFFTLFAVFYHLMFDLDDRLDAKNKKAKARSLPASMRAGLLKVHKNLSEKTAPAAVLEAAARRTTHKSSREALHKYCLKMIEA
jgi:hypothetical protein